ncbi:hypothetical protein HS088_TW07G01171 [Tripterygium wilfordii]|uniref:Uncharacterized protein n=1 Tax=Tripterygium wilfordii TaxID=458696 RepID=A0A7J7DH37_TRIWF|nr:hypothetical protein HS088_TW07G01171 [Tripterygium wilfordii]
MKRVMGYYISTRTSKFLNLHTCTRSLIGLAMMSNRFWVKYLGYPPISLAVMMQSTSAVDYVVTNRAGSSGGSVRFNNEIGIPYSRQTLDSATNFIWRIFQQNRAADRKNVQKPSQLLITVREISNLEYFID